MKRSLLLVEVLVGLALLALIGVLLVRIQASAIRQAVFAEQREQVVQRVRELLWTWSAAGERVTLPAHGQLDALHTWERSGEPIRVLGAVTATLVRVVVFRTDIGGEQETYRVEWLVLEGKAP